MKIASIIGARPQFIKAAAVSRAINEHNRLQSQTTISPEAHVSLDIEEILIHTGQHYDDVMSEVFFRELEIPQPKYNLDIGSGSHGDQTGRMLSAIEKVLMLEKPDWVLIYGDTNSTLAGALAAAKLHIPIAHVEAGLRSFNRLMPEEVNRLVADQLSTVLFCPSEKAVENLRHEGIGGTERQGLHCRKVVISGDVMADALQFAAIKASIRSRILSRLNLQPKGYLLATVHRAENTDNRRRLHDILLAFAALDETVVFPAHPRTRKLLKDSGCQLPGNVLLIEPVGYFDIIELEKSARIILTDSGGMQKEAYWLKVPCITLRDETEWVETLDSGWNILTGADRSRIIEAVCSFNPPVNHPPLYGDGKAADLIVQELSQWLF